MTGSDEGEGEVKFRDNFDFQTRKELVEFLQAYGKKKGEFLTSPDFTGGVFVMLLRTGKFVMSYEIEDSAVSEGEYGSVEEAVESFTVKGKRLYEFCPMLHCDVYKLL